MSQSQIMFGQINSLNFKFLPGLNLFMYVCRNKHNILEDIILKNNEGAQGNLYMTVNIVTLPYTHYHENILYHVGILIFNMTSIQTRRASLGMVIQYKIIDRLKGWYNR